VAMKPLRASSGCRAVAISVSSHIATSAHRTACPSR
jgi:hypothetical protein